MNAGTKPIMPPRSGTMRASSASVGTVCSMPAVPSTYSDSLGRRLARMPSGMLTTSPTASAAIESNIWPPR